MTNLFLRRRRVSAIAVAPRRSVDGTGHRAPDWDLMIGITVAGLIMGGFVLSALGAALAAPGL